MTISEIKTEDGSSTFYNDKVGDIYHCRSGAVREAIEKYAKPCKIAELAKKGEIRVLDAFFGLGYNSCAALDAALEVNPSCRIIIEGLEIDPEILSKIAQVEPSFKHFGMIKRLAQSEGYQYTEGNVALRILLGDARERVIETQGGFDAVFLDPFSPKLQPELWQKAFFEDIRAKMRNLEAAGFIVSDGPVVGRRSPSTLAMNPGK
jgi:tRNA U34 5-methylaminomethyl-2-thiouridine-forming methyltransferase MnmC